MTTFIAFGWSLPPNILCLTSQTAALEVLGLKTDRNIPGGKFLFSIKGSKHTGVHILQLLLSTQILNHKNNLE